MARNTVDLTKVNVSELTLENFRERTGHRFRMTAEQKTRNLSREDAFREFLTTLTTPVSATPSSN